jgi:1-acyl-sn-glycerol-3-phosphate acyltransferase
LAGWRTEGQLPAEPRFVLVAAPHTSNWDGVIMFLGSRVFEYRLAWLGKQELFHGPLGAVLRALGGVPVDRASAHTAVAAAILALSSSERMALAIPPEGTRHRASHWKMGFYLIARRARVPLVLGYIDYGRRVAGLGPTLTPSGDVEADMEIIRRFYSGVTALHPESVGEIRPAPR